MTIECIEFIIDCLNITKRSEAGKLLFQSILVLNWVKKQLFHVIIIKGFKFMFILRIFRCKMQSDSYENGLKFL